jgi:beta-xylosidase
MADPFIQRVSGGYYAYGTDAADEPVFKKTRHHFPVLFSKDLKRWELVGGAVQSDLKCSFWAPEVVERDGKFYIFYSCGGEQGVGQTTRVAIADKPEGPFIPAGAPLFPSLPFSIDASPFHDPVSGDWFLFFSRDFLNGNAGTGIAMCGLGPDMKPLTQPKTILRGSRDWQVYERNRHWYNKTWRTWYTLEGTKVVYHEGRYVLFYSGGNWQTKGYGVNYAVAEQVQGPYKPANDPSGAALLRSGMAGLRGPGHNSVFTGLDGRQYIVFHAWNEDLTMRQMYIAPLSWNAKGEPEVEL